jgi:hypothetical protein
MGRTAFDRGLFGTHRKWPGRLGRWFVLLRRIAWAYRHDHGRLPRLFRPRRYTEKMQWRKAFDLDPRYAILCDKLASRDFVAARLGSGFSAPLLWQGADPARIPFDDLTPPYVVKSSHASGRTRDDVMTWADAHGRALSSAMVAAARRLAAGFDHLRVDFYEGCNRFWVGELSVYSFSGLLPLVPDEADLRLGEHWQLRRPLWRAMTVLLTRDWDIPSPAGLPHAAPESGLATSSSDLPAASTPRNTSHTAAPSISTAAPT